MSQDIHYSRMFKELPAPYMMLDCDLKFIDANDAYLAITSRTRDALIGQYVFDAFPEKPERLAIVKAAFEQALAGETNTLTRTWFEIERAEADGGGMQSICWDSTHVPVRTGNGDIVGLMQKVKDVTAEVHAERTRDTVLREFDHRLKNILAKVVAIAHRTAASSENVRDFMMDFDDRITALANTQNLLMRQQWTAAALQDLVEAELAPYLGGNATDQWEIIVTGPQLQLKGKVAQAIGMALHELTTNAAKYGALSLLKGRLDVAWRVDAADNQVAIMWHETGFSVAHQPERTGFGSTIIDIITPKEINGTVVRRFDHDGHHCQITMPLDYVLAS